MAEMKTAENLKIRKYPNRRYYDTTRSRHVTLEEIHTLIRQGHEIEVTDSVTGEDITAKVLAQLLIELDPLKLGVFPVPMLHRLLRSNEQAVGEFVEKYFNQPLAAFLESQRDFERYMHRLWGVRAAGPTVAEWARTMWGSLGSGAPWLTPQTRETKVDRDGGTAAKAPGAEASSPPVRAADPPTDWRQELVDLRQQLAALQREMGSPNKKASRRRG